MMDAESIKAAPVLDAGPIETKNGAAEPPVEDA